MESEVVDLIEPYLKGWQIGLVRWLRCGQDGADYGIDSQRPAMKHGGVSGVRGCGRAPRAKAMTFGWKCLKWRRESFQAIRKMRAR